MPRATLTSRELKNKKTGLDLFVPSYNETKGMVTSTVHYQVVLVSSLACFKTPSQKESDVVQYSVEKKWNEFEELRNKVAEIFAGTTLPTINKKAIIVSEIVLRERRNSLDNLMKFMASVSKLATCAPLLEFLGVDPIRAKKFSQGESLEGTAAPSQDEGKDDDAEEEDPSVDFLEKDVGDQGDTDLFSDGLDTKGDEDMFGAGDDTARVSMFEEQDMKRELTEEDEKDFGFIPDAIIKKTETIKVVEEQDEDNEDLFKIEDDLDQLMTVDVGKKKKAVPTPESPTSAEKPVPRTRPTPPSKPKPAMKPSIPSKPQSGADKEPNEKLGASAGSVPAKPVPAPRPKPAPRTKINSLTENPDGASAGKVTSPEASQAAPTEPASSADNLGQDDIMKYLQENASSNTDDVDLFS